MRGRGNPDTKGFREGAGVVPGGITRNRQGEHLSKGKQEEVGWEMGEAGMERAENVGQGGGKDLKG